MIGLIMIAAFAVYLLVTIVVVRFTIRWARRNGRGVKRWAVVAVFVMYNLVFWDLIPTYVLYKYYCTTKAGFWVYKTPEEWKNENPGVAETLNRAHSHSFQNSDGSIGMKLNERFTRLQKARTTTLLPVTLYDASIIDVKNNEVLVERISIGAGYPAGKGFIRFWTNINSCVPENNKLDAYTIAYRDLGGE
ncbi:MAG: hypothetical protein JXQ81_06645 [Desulfuromonadales bacterium]|nr:hypothetical protein [Desulfuromonadales bacterium]MBN2792167.1 hypothetical protein [Desulfuromonadales bacterium]